MMLLLLAKRLRHCSIIPNHKIRPFLDRFCSGSAIQIPDLKASHFNVVNYLVNSCGLSSEKAARISKPISHLKSPQNPDAVLRLLKQQGFAEVEINTLITLRPSLLCFLEKSVDTNLRALRDIGLSNAALTQIILSNPAALHLRSAVPRIQFWRDFLGGDATSLMKAFKHNRNLITSDISRRILPKLSLIQSHGLSTQDLRRIMHDFPMFITFGTHLIEDSLNRTKELGFTPNSKMFVHGLHAMAKVSRVPLQKKMELLKSFGWSEDEFLSALRVAPNIVCLSEKNLQIKMHFLIGEVRCEPSYIASNPILLKFSLVKRLRPRFHVLQCLESKGLSGRRQSFNSVMTVSENKFVEKYILPHKEEVSGLHEAYLAACA